MSIKILPNADRDMGAWYQDEPYNAIYSLLNNGVDTPDYNTYIDVEYYNNDAECSFYMSTPPAGNIIESITLRALISAEYSWQEWYIGLYDSDDNVICESDRINQTSGIISATITGEFEPAFLADCYAKIIAYYGEGEPDCDIYEIDCVLTTGGEILPDIVRNETVFRLTLSGDSGDVTNWTPMFDNSVWDGNGVIIDGLVSGAYWSGTKWRLAVGSCVELTIAEIEPAGTDFDTFRPAKCRITFSGAENLDITVTYADENESTYPAVISGDFFVLSTASKITKITFTRDDVCYLYPSITNIEFYDADYEPTVYEDAIVPLANCMITFKIDMKNSDGEQLPAWESTDDPFANGYDDEKSIYRISFSGTVPSLNYISEMLNAATTGNDLIFEYSVQTVNGVRDWNELTFIRPALKIATPPVASQGAQSNSVTLYAEKESKVSDFTWDYQEVDISGVSFRGPNQQGGKWTYNMAGLITGIKPGYRAAYNGESFVVGEIQYIINTTGIQTYLKEY